MAALLFGIPLRQGFLSPAPVQAQDFKPEKFDPGLAEDFLREQKILRKEMLWQREILREEMAHVRLEMRHIMRMSSLSMKEEALKLRMGLEELQEEARLVQEEIAAVLEESRQNSIESRKKLRQELRRMRQKAKTLADKIEKVLADQRPQKTAIISREKTEKRRIVKRKTQNRPKIRKKKFKRQPKIRKVKQQTVPKLKPAVKRNAAVQSTQVRQKKKKPQIETPQKSMQEEAVQLSKNITDLKNKLKKANGDPGTLLAKLGDAYLTAQRFISSQQDDEERQKLLDLSDSQGLLLGSYEQAAWAYKLSLDFNHKSAETHLKIGKIYDDMEDGKNAIMYAKLAHQIFKRRHNSTQMKEAQTFIETLTAKYENAS